MPVRQQMTGVFPVAPTIFRSDGTIDEDGLRRVLDYIVGSGAAGLVYPGLASEVDTLEHEERVRLTRRVGEWIGGRIAFIVGASAESLDDTIAFARAGASVGAVAAMVMTPKLPKGTTDALCGHYERLEAAVEIPLMLQNAPPPMGLGLSVEEVAAVARRVGGVRWVKEEAVPSGQRITRLRDAARDALSGVYGGAGARYVLDELRRGALGTMPACEISEVHVAMLDRFERGDEPGARDLFERTLPLLSMQAIFRWRLTKEVLRRRGLIGDAYARAAGPALDDGDHRELDTLLSRIADLMAASPAMVRPVGAAA